MLIKLQQGSEEWLLLRRQKVTASDAAVVMGVGFTTPRKRWMEKMGLLEVKKTLAMDYGSSKEEEDRQAFCKTHGLWMEPAVFVSDKYPWMMASLDGITPEHDAILETKRTSKFNHLTAKSGKIPEIYWPQIQHQLICCDVTRAYYQSCWQDERVVVEVFRDDVYCGELLAQEEIFWKCVSENEAPELIQGDYTYRDDEDFLRLASVTAESARELEAAKKRYEANRQQLIKMAGTESCVGGGVTVRHGLSKGSISYKDIPELKNVDVEKYRAASRETWTVVIDK